MPKIYKLYGGDGRLILAGTMNEIADHMGMDPNYVRKRYKRGSFTNGCRIESTEKELQEKTIYNRIQHYEDPEGGLDPDDLRNIRKTLRIGDQVITDTRILTVTGLYRHIFTAEYKGISYSFQYADILRKKVRRIHV